MRLLLLKMWSDPDCRGSGRETCLVVGTHTHTPSADCRVLPGGTAYITDAGVTGNYDSIAGMEKSEPINQFVNGHTVGSLCAGRGSCDGVRCFRRYGRRGRSRGQSRGSQARAISRRAETSILGMNGQRFRDERPNACKQTRTTREYSFVRSCGRADDNRLLQEKRI